MAIAAAICDSFKTEMLTATHNFTASTGDSFKMALYPSTATYNNTTTAYSGTGEVTSANYTAGGIALTSSTPVSDGAAAVCNFAAVTWQGVTLTARGAVIYNNSKSNKAVCVLDFGADKTATSGNFTVTFPAAAAATAIIRFP